MLEKSHVSSAAQTSLQHAWEMLVKANTMSEAVRVLALAAREVADAAASAIVTRAQDEFVVISDDPAGYRASASAQVGLYKICTTALCLKSPVVVSDVLLGEFVANGIGSVIRSAAFIPVEDREISGISLLWTDRATLSVDQIATIQSLCRTAAAVVARLRERFEEEVAFGQMALRADEMRHRLKNAYASAIGFAHLSMPEELAAQFSTRIRCLVSSYELLDRPAEGSTEVALSDLLIAILRPYQRGTDFPITLLGPDVAVPAAKVSGVGLIVNELATNALKHGALSSAHGTVRVEWIFADDDLTISWSERSRIASACVSPQTGSLLMEKIARHQLGGTIEHSLSQHGALCSLSFRI